MANSRMIYTDGYNIKGINPWDVDGNPEAWATRVARNRAIDVHRLHDRHPVTGPVEGGTDPDAPVRPELERAKLQRFLELGGHSPSFLTLTRLQCEAILAALDDDDRRLLAEAAEGRSYADIAERLGWKDQDVVRRRLHRLRVKAREASQAAGFDTPWDVHPRQYG